MASDPNVKNVPSSVAASTDAAVADAEARERDIKSLRYEIQDEWRVEDERVTSAVLVDLAALIRTGVLTMELRGAEITFSRSYYPSMEVTLPSGEQLTVTLQRKVERPMNAEEAAQAAYDAGRTPKRQRDW